MNMPLKDKLLQRVPKWSLRYIAKPYIAGDTLQEALEKADHFKNDYGVYSTIDLLGEDVRDVTMAKDALKEYERIVLSIKERPYVYVSIKPTILGLAIDSQMCLEHYRKLAEMAKQNDRFLRVEMEDHTTTDDTLALFRKLREEYDNVGLVLQSRLFRTAKDIEALSDLKPNIRICIGIYNEPPEIAMTQKPKMKDALIEYAEKMLGMGFYVALATHDEQTVSRLCEMIRKNDYSNDSYEFQMLMGVPRAKVQLDLVEKGHKVRLYVPYGELWHHYVMRRLGANPNVGLYVMKNLFNMNETLR